MTITKTYSVSEQENRYHYDFNLTSDFAQLDTSEDASYFGNWASAKQLTFISYCEGDFTKVTCETVDEFKQEFENFLQFCKRIGYDFKGIDPGFLHSEEILAPWKNCGLDHLIH